VTPVRLDVPSNVGNDDIGVTLSGAPLAPPAPVADILGNFTVAIFDDCGGHINTNAGYHFHGATECMEFDLESDGHAPLIAYAIDGYPIYSMTDMDGEEPIDLDECRGH